MDGMGAGIVWHIGCCAMLADVLLWLYAGHNGAHAACIAGISWQQDAAWPAMDDDRTRGSCQYIMCIDLNKTEENMLKKQ